MNTPTHDSQSEMQCPANRVIEYDNIMLISPDYMYIRNRRENSIERAYPTP